MTMQTAGKLYQESNTKNCAFNGKSVNGREELSEHNLAATFQRKVSSKNEIVIGNKCRQWAAYLFRQYDKPVPGWLRVRLIINQRRRKQLNDLLWEANVGKAYCGQCLKSDEWDYHLHCLWHLINGKGGAQCL